MLNRRLKNIFVTMNTIIIFWSLFTSFPFAFGYFFRFLFYGKFTLLLYAIYIISSLIIIILNSKIIDLNNLKYSLSFSLVFLIIWVLQVYLYDFPRGYMAFYTAFGAIFILTRDSIKIDIFKTFINALAFILFLGIIEFAIYGFTGVGIVLYRNIRRLGIIETQTFNQLLFNFVSSGGANIGRFQSLAEEPGLIGTTCGFAIFSIRGIREFSRQYYVFIVAGLLSFSLAFYIILAIHLIINTGISKNFIFMILISILVYVIFEDFFQEIIWKRLTTKSVNELDNRVGSNFQIYLNKSFTDGSIWFGNGEKISFLAIGNKGNAGVKVWIYQYGIVSLFLVLSFYIIYYIKKIKEYSSEVFNCLLFFMIFWLSFYQRQNINNPDYLIFYLTVPIIYARKTLK